MVRNEVQLPTLGELSAINAEHSAGAVAFMDGDRAVTWGEFDAEGRRAAHAFRRTVRQGDRVAFLCGASVDQLGLWNGALKAGGVVTNLHHRASLDTIAYCVDEAAPKVLVLDERFADFVTEELLDAIETNPPELVVVGDDTPEAATDHRSFVESGRGAAETAGGDPDVSIEADDIAVIGWTSGTTGRPKGWCHTHRSIVLKGRGRGTDRTVRRITTTSPSFMAWYNNVVPITLGGASLIFLPAWDPEAWAERVEELGATHAGMVPTMWREILALDLEDYDLSSLEQITFTGEKISATTLRRLREEICDTVQNAYASTELNIATINDAELTDERIESVGKPSAGTRVRIVEEDGAPDATKPAGEVGEIIVKGPDCPVWVWGDTGTTREEFTDGWWYSGDLGYQDEDGFLYVEGRKDFMITSRGVTFNPHPVEERLNGHPAVEEAVVVGVDDEEYGQRVTAIVRRGGEVTAEELDEWCLESETVARFERPRAYEFIEGKLPRTSTGKLDRKTATETLTTRPEE